MSSLSSGTPIRKSASGQVSGTSGSLRGLYVNSTTSGILDLFDEVNTAGPASTAFARLTLVAGTYVQLPASLANGLYCTLVSGSADVTFLIG